MSQGDWQLAQGDALTRFLGSAVKAERFAEFYTGETAEPTRDVGPDDVSFCRRVFRQTHAGRRVDPAQALPCREVVLSGDNTTVSFSEFRPLPYHLQRWLQVDLFAPHSGAFTFRLATCGGVRIWQGDRQLACFTPFTRNTLQHTEVNLPLKAGKNSLLIHLDELSERDTTCALQMISLNETTLGVALPVVCPQTLSAPPYTPHIHSAQARDDSASRLLILMQQREYGPELDVLLYRTLKRISAREEGSVYALLPLLWLWHFHQGEYFPEVLWRRVKSTLQGYRYWQDERGCDVMAFWGDENALAFHTAQYLAGQFFPEGLFIASCRRGRQQQILAQARLEQWFATTNPHGLSETFALLALERMADSTALRERAATPITGVKA
ncbi:MAG: hypothetical protein RSE29_09920 [Leclercia sp.]